MRRSRIAVGIAAALIAAPLIAAPLLVPTVAFGEGESPNYAAEVNTFIGSQDQGNTFPGASAPFGMTQVSPTGTWLSGWTYGDSQIRGFGHSYVSGAGCWEQGGIVSVLPTTGTVGPGEAFDTASGNTFDHTRYAASATHEGEVGQAGYYRTKLTSYGGIDVEATATTRVGLQRYTFPATQNANVFINTGQANAAGQREVMKIPASSIKVEGDTVTGSVTAQGFCSGQGYTYTAYFAAKANAPITGYGTWNSQGGQPSVAEQANGAGLKGAWLTFDTTANQQVEVAVALSYTSVDGALKNLAGEGLTPEGTPRDFDEVRTQTQATWNAELGKVAVQGGPTDQRTSFYTALYHALIQPNTATDVDGAYMGFDKKVHVADGWTYYQFLSLWDTYRTQNQLLAAFWPDRARDIANTVLTIRAQGGWLPRWAYVNYETNCMTGDPVSSFLADLWRYGAIDDVDPVVLPGTDTASGQAVALDVKTAYEALVENVDKLPPAESQFAGRAGNANYVDKGWIDHSMPQKKGHGDDRYFAGSATLEYAVSDCAVAQMAAALGDTDNAERLSQRGGNWANVWDKDLADTTHGFTGFPRAKEASGTWSYGSITGSGESVGFEEGTPWQYQWLTWQDMAGVTEAMGGKKEALKRLDTFFDIDTVRTDPAKAARNSWVIGALNYSNNFRYNPNNEPDLHAPWLYNFLGEPAKSSLVAHAALTLFTNAPNGVTGNDDLGTMSAWYVFASLGLYPGVPGSGELLISAPAFEKVDIDLGGGKTLTINAPGAGVAQGQMIAGLTVDGQEWKANHISIDRLAPGARLDHVLTTDEEATAWGKADNEVPAPPCASVELPAREIELLSAGTHSVEAGKDNELWLGRIFGAASQDPTQFTASVRWDGQSTDVPAQVVYHQGELHLVLDATFEDAGTARGTVTVNHGGQMATMPVVVEVTQGDDPAPTPPPTVDPTPSVAPTAAPTTPNEPTAGPTEPATPAPGPSSAAPSGGLPLTGAALTGAIVVGLALVAAGVALVAARRRRQA